MLLNSRRHGRAVNVPDQTAHGQGWDVGFEAHELRQLHERANWTLAQKLEWLEAAQQTLEAILRAGQVARREQSPGKDKKSDE